MHHQGGGRAFPRLMITTLTLDLLIQAAYALAIGLVIGMEREHHQVAETIESDEAPVEHGIDKTGDAIGVRTFALLSLMGWASGQMGLMWPWIPPVALAVIGVLVTAKYIITREQGKGLTTEAAALLTCLLGLLVNLNRPLAVALALATTLLLISKPWMHGWVIKLRRIELTATLQLLILLAIVLPLLPSEPVDPWNALPPRKIGLFVILIAGLSFVGYVLSRIMDERKSAGLTGLLGGLASSTAVTVAMSNSGRNPDMRVPSQLAVFLANAVMFGRVLVITAVLNRALTWRLALPMSAMGGIMLLGAVWAWRQMNKATKANKSGKQEQQSKRSGPRGYAPRDADEDDGHDGQQAAVAGREAIQNPFALIPALKWGVVLSAVLLFAVLARRFLGDSGTVVAAAVSGLADVDAITLAITRQVPEDIDMSIATLGITVAVVSNTIVKGGMALIRGGRKFGIPIAIVFAISMSAGILAVLLV